MNRRGVAASAVAAMFCLLTAGGGLTTTSAAAASHWGTGVQAVSSTSTAGTSPFGWRSPSQVAEFTGLGKGVELGSSVSVSGDGSTALVSAPAYPPTGAAFVFSESNGAWRQVAKLMPSQPMSKEEFGYAVALSANGSTAIVGAPFPSSTIGAAYVFKDVKGTWRRVARLRPSGDAEFFGAGVALSADGSTAMIGAYETDHANGAAFVFSEEGGIYTQTARITPPADAFYFGNAVSLSRNGRTAAIGADGGAYFTNSAYIYAETAGSWEQAAAFSDPGGDNTDDFGGAVAISSNGSTAVVGASGDHSWLGAAYVFRKRTGGWAQTTKLLASGGQPGDLFGGSVGVGAHGSRVLVGAMGQNQYAGAAYVFNHGRTGLRQVATLYRSDPGVYNMYGSSAALSASGTTAVIGSDAYRGAAYDGAAYVVRASSSR